MSEFLTTNIPTFNSVLRRYHELNKLSLDETLEKKGRDLGIRLYQGFSFYKFGGPGKPRKGLAMMEVRQRSAAGIGTKVRPSLMREYLAKRRELRASLKGKRSTLASIKRRVSLWQSFVGREAKIRQMGIGVLAASFLWYRKRRSQAKGTYYVKNKTGKTTLGYVQKEEGFLRIVGLTDGLTEVDARHQIVGQALAGATTDMLTYIQRKERENFLTVFKVA